MRTLFGKLESPAVTDLTVTFSAARPDSTPDVIPDLYRGEPVALAVKVSALAGTLEIKGMIGDRPWVVTLPLANAAEGRGLSKLWARRKIVDSEIARTLRQVTPDEADQRILALALEHHLVTRLTSLVAVDQTPSRADGVRLTRTDLPLNLPASWEFDKVFGGERSRAPVPAERRAFTTPPRHGDVYAAVTVSRAPSPAVPKFAAVAAPRDGATLPKTATDAELRLGFGLALCFASLLLMVIRRRRGSSSSRFST
jgi:Ca-activated chloride channel family protein